MSKEIRIDDLQNPILDENQQAALDFTKDMKIDLSRDSILNEAKQKTGLGFMGSEDFIERLDLLVNEWNADDGITNIGRLTLRNKLLQHATSRLLIEDTLQKKPEILDIEIKEPIIVVGLPRSGTTHLLNLMAADSRLRALPLWESYEPVPMPGEATPEDTCTDPRYQRCAESWGSMQQFTPLLAAMHPMNPDHIHEELELMGPDFASYNYEWLSHSPNWRDHYYTTDQTPHYAYMKKVMKILMWQNNEAPQRWVLKCPQHLEQLPVLKKTFPDASFAVTHRDPVAVIQSTVTMLAYGQRMSRFKVDTKSLINYWTDRIEHLLKACVEDRHILPAEHSIDVPFHEFMADDLAMVERIYNKAQLPMHHQNRAELQDYIDQHPRGKHGQIIYNLRDDFGIDPNELRKRFNFYFEKFSAKPEIK